MMGITFGRRSTWIAQAAETVMHVTDMQVVAVTALGHQTTQGSKTMATSALHRTRPLSVGTWVLPGLLAGMVFAMWAMVVGLFTSSVWASGMMYGLAVYLVMFWVVVRGMLTSNSSSFLTANPEWSWIVAHAMFGAALGGLTALFFRRETIRH
jgi:hypothetical protein